MHPNLLEANIGTALNVPKINKTVARSNIASELSQFEKKNGANADKIFSTRHSFFISWGIGWLSGCQDHVKRRKS